jgi:hypothetical protein
MNVRTDRGLARLLRNGGAEKSIAADWEEENKMRRRLAKFWLQAKAKLRPRWLDDHTSTDQKWERSIHIVHAKFSFIKV